MSTSEEPATPSSDLADLERLEIALERRIATLEARLDVARDVFSLAAQELASLDGMRGWVSRLTGGYASKVEASQVALEEARDIVQKTTADLSDTREKLAVARRGCAEARRLQQEDVERALRAQRIAEGPIHLAEQAVEGVDEPERTDVLRVKVISLGRTAAADLDAVLASTRDKSGVLAGGPAALEMLGDVCEYAIDAGWVEDAESLRAMLRHIGTRIAPAVDPGLPPGSGNLIVITELRGLVEVCDDRLHRLAPRAESHSLHTVPDDADLESA